MDSAMNKLLQPGFLECVIFVQKKRQGKPHDPDTPGSNHDGNSQVCKKCMANVGADITRLSAC
eukprot:286291-Alexandrium_andersonii.AAC.1